MMRFSLWVVLLLSLSVQPSAQAYTITIEAPSADALLTMLEDLADQMRLRRRPTPPPVDPDPPGSDVNCSASAGACIFTVPGPQTTSRVVQLHASLANQPVIVKPDKFCDVGDTDIPGFPYGFPKKYTATAGAQVTVPIVALENCTIIAGETIVNVAGGGNLQTAIDNATPGTTVLLAQGATFTGQFTLRAGRTGWTTIRGAGTGANIVATGPDGAFPTEQTARYYYLDNLTVTQSQLSWDHIRLGTTNNSQNTLASVPEYFVMDRMKLHGNPATGGRRGASIQTGYTKFTNSEIKHIFGAGIETHGIHFGNGPGPYFIADNLIEAAAINILAGGLDPPIIGMVPENIIVTRNTIRKDPVWQLDAGITVKNLIEWKTARHVVVSYNDFENMWASAAAPRGLSSWNKSVDQVVSGTYDCTLCEVRDVLYTHNRWLKVGGGPQVTSVGEGTPIPMSNIRFVHNFFEIDATLWTTQNQGGAGTFMLTLQGTHGAEFRNNTIINVTPSTTFAFIENNQPWCSASGCPNNGFVFQNNIFTMNGKSGESYQWHPGKGTLFSTQFPDYVWNGNIYEYTGTNNYPAGNFPLTAGQLVSVAKYNHTTRLLDNDSPYKNAGVGGVDPGWDGTGGRPQ
jgi:hypothetical protein